MQRGVWRVAGLPGAAEVTGLRSLQQMVPRTLPNSDILCQVTAGHDRRAHSRCSNTCIPSSSIRVLGFSYKSFSEHLWKKPLKATFSFIPISEDTPRWLYLPDRRTPLKVSCVRPCSPREGQVLNRPCFKKEWKSTSCPHQDSRAWPTKGP